jgi:hypothetical protein
MERKRTPHHLRLVSVDNICNITTGMITSSPSAENGKRRRKLNIPRYQWFWAANYRDISALTPDLTHTVKRHVIVKRVIPIHAFPVSRLESAREVLRAAAWKEKAERSHAPEDQKAAYDSLNIRQNQAWEGLLADWRSTDRRMPLEYLLEFKFCILVR